MILFTPHMLMFTRKAVFVENVRSLSIITLLTLSVLFKTFVYGSFQNLSLGTLRSFPFASPQKFLFRVLRSILSEKFRHYSVVIFRPVFRYFLTFAPCHSLRSCLVYSNALYSFGSQNRTEVYDLTKQLDRNRSWLVPV